MVIHKSEGKASKRRTGIGNGSLFVALLVVMAPLVQATPITYTFIFQPSDGSAMNRPLPSGGFVYDDSTGLFSAFQVAAGGVLSDFTAAANVMTGRARLPYELGILSQNLITGIPAVGFAYWWADDSGFRGFDWRTPAADFLHFELDPTFHPLLEIYTGPNAYSGTWSTQITTPEPGSLGLAGACAALLAACKRRAGV